MRAPAVDERAAREAICDIARDIWLRGLGAGGDGNLSVRLDDERVLTTPSACHKGRLKPADLLVVDFDGRVRRGPAGRKPSSELVLHLAAYQARSSIGAVIHAHPPAAVALELAGIPLSAAYVSEIVFSFGLPATAPYTTPTTETVGAVLGEYLRCHDVVMMPRHGSVTVGPDLDTAFLRLDAFEHSARITWMAHAAGSPTPIDAAELDHLHAVAGRARPAPGCPPLEPASRASTSAPAGRPWNDATVIDAVLAALRGQPR